VLEQQLNFGSKDVNIQSESKNYAPSFCHDSMKYSMFFLCFTVFVQLLLQKVWNRMISKYTTEA